MSANLVLKKFRELQRDLLYLRFGEDWTKHQHSPGTFYADPSKQDADMLELIGRYAELGEVPDL